MFLDAYYHSLYDKKGLGVYLRVAGNDQQKLILVDLDITLLLPLWTGHVNSTDTTVRNPIIANNKSE